jgi:copper chaperone CopZ
MGKQLDSVAGKQREIHEKTKISLKEKQVEIDTAEMEINRIKRVLETKDAQTKTLECQLTASNEKLADISNDIELKAGENNRLRKQVADMEVAI